MRVSWCFLAATGCAPHLTSPEETDDPDEVWVAPENDWPSAAPPEGLRAEGFEVGEVVPDFRLLDQFDQTVSLWQFYGSVVVLDVSTMWCSPCQKLAESTEAMWQEHKDEGFVYVTVLAQDVEGNPPDNADLNAWAAVKPSSDEDDITAPVISDPEGGYSDDALALTGSQYPVVLVLDREMRASTLVIPPEDALLEDAVEAELDED